MKNKLLHKGEAKTILIIFVFVILTLIGTFIYYTAKNTLVDKYKNRNSIAEHTVPIVTPTPQYNLKKKAITKKSCYSTELGLEFSIPSNWKCENSKNILVMTSDYFLVNISNIKRNSYCGKEPIPDEVSCTTTPYYVNNAYSINLYSLNGESKEYWGYILRSSILPNTWVSIKYKNMEYDNLLPDKNAEIINILNSIKVTN